MGSVLVPVLLNRGFSVTVVDNLVYRQNSLAAVCYHPNLTLIRGDVRSVDTMRPVLEDAECIIPLAALVGAPVCSQNPLAATSTNLDAIDSMLDEISTDQCVILPSTNSAYGTAGNSDSYCTEETPMTPVSLYARDKVEIERRALDQHPKTVSLRFATVFGMSPRMRLDLLVNDFTYRAFSDGFLVLFESQFKRNYIHIRDVSRAFLHAIDNSHRMQGEAYNVGHSDANLSKFELCERIQRHLPQFVFFESDKGSDLDRRDYLVSNGKIQATGFVPEYSLDQGLIELIKGYTMICPMRYTNV